MRRISTITALALALGLLATEAAAIIGRPLTPVSYAGVARRSVRRGAATTAVAATATAAAVATAPLTTLPAGCTTVPGPAYVCGTTTYRPQYQGTSVVYVPAQ